MKDELGNRRDFHRWSVAAVGGLLAGTVTGCGEKGSAPTTPATTTPQVSAKTADDLEVHLCRGLNSCKGQGGCGGIKGKNECAGHGGCATAERHTCGEQNTCKGLGGCGKNPGENECKGHGGCAVPLMDHAWKKVRAKFEEKMKTANKKFGDAPPAKS